MMNAILNIYKSLIVLFISLFLMSSDVFAADSSTIKPDSSTIKPPGTVTPKSPTSVVETDTLNATNPANYDSLLDCPSESALNCPDINGKLSNSSLAENCPPACKVKDVTTKYTVSGVDYVNTYTPGKCPANYILATAYQMDKEVIYKENPPAYPVPIPNQAILDSYQGRSGTVCVPVDPVRTFKHCQTGSADYTTGMVGFYQGGYAWIQGSRNSGKCYFPSTCPPPSGIVPASCGDPSTKRLWYVDYKYYQCTPASGYFYTGYDAPSRKVCVRKHMIWS